MQYVYKNDLTKVYEESSCFVDEEGTQYGADWRIASIVGMQGIIDTQHPDTGENVILGHHLEIVNDLPTVVWDYRPKTNEETREDVKRGKLNELDDIERSITPRRLREAILTAEGRAYLQSKEDAIVTLRGHLK